jgi:hypothetical protein
MPTATIDGLEVNYVTRGSGPALLMLAPIVRELREEAE